MTQPSKPFQSNKDKDKDKDKESAKSSSEIESEIGETRNAISGDIKALSDKFTPAHIKDQAKDAMGSVKDAAVEQAAEIKDAVVDKAVEVKDAVVEKAVEVKDAATEKIVEAKDAVVEVAQDVGEQAMRAGSATWRFTKANAIPLALVGVGAGWLIASNRGGRARRLEPGYGPYRGEAWDEDTDRYSNMTSPPQRRPAQRAMTSGRAAGNGAKREPAASRMGARAHDVLEKAEETAQRAENKVIEGATRSAKYVQQKFQVAREATSEFAVANPLLVAMATLAAGIGIGMLLPSTERENKLLAPSRAKFSHLMGDVREAATDVAQIAKDRASDSVQAMR